MENVVYEDEAICVLDKPSGLLVTPSSNVKKPSLLELLNNQAQKNNLSYRFHPCHRIDKETSGLVLFAKGKKYQSFLMEEFKARRVGKVYTAFIRGRLVRKEAQLQSQIRAFRKKDARPAKLHYKVVGQRAKWSVVEIRPSTGWMHQIRIQFAQIGHPLLGERIYAFRKDFEVDFRRLALHAMELSFIHPVNKKRAVFRCELARDMKQFLQDKS